MFAKSLSAAAMVHSRNGYILEVPLVRLLLGTGLAWLDAPKVPLTL